MNSSRSRVVPLAAVALMLAVMVPVAGAASDQVSFATAESYAAGKVLYDLTSADLNGDGRPDLATANGGSSFGASNVSVLLNTTELTETARCTITGTGRDDVLEDTGGRDIICGRGGDDRIKGNQATTRSWVAAATMPSTVVSTTMF